jgi:hypothetical protein
MEISGKFPAGFETRFPAHPLNQKETMIIEWQIQLLVGWKFIFPLSEV